MESKYIIEANHIGIKFKLSRFKKVTVRSFFNDLLKGSSTKQNKEFWAIKDVSFALEEGEILGVVGSNGSGKSTLLRIIAGVYEPDKGIIQVNGSVSPLLS